MKILHTTILNRYIFKFFIRLIIFSGVFILYLTGKDNFMDVLNMKVLPLPGFDGVGITILHVLWLIFMTMMIIHLIPPKVFTMALLRRQKERLERVDDYSRQELLEYVADQNAKACFTSFLVLLKWEMTYAKHPERFWEGSNKVLKCSNCKDKSCQFKKALKRS